MLNKNDPLIGAVQEVMKRNQAERNATKLVNEKFGVTDRKAIPHERQHEWDSAYKSVLNESDDLGPVKKKESAKMYKHKTSGKEIKSVTHPGKEWEVMKEELHPNQEPLDMNKNRKLDSDDFRMLRAKKKPMEEDMTSPSSMGIKKPNYAPAGTTPDYAKPTTQTVNRSAKTSMPAGTVKEESLDEKITKSTPVKNVISDFVHSKNPKFSGDTKKKRIERALGAYYSKHPEKKKMKVDEGFNNRHNSSVNASVEEQVVADQLDEAGINPAIVQQRQKKAQQAATNKKMTGNIKAREPRDPTAFERFQAREKVKPTPVTGGVPVPPLGGPVASIAKTVARAAPGIASRAYNYLRGGSGAQAQSSNLAAGAARRPSGPSVPQVQSSGQGNRIAAARRPESGPWGSATRRGGDARASSGGAPSGTFAARLQASRQAQQGRAGGSTVSANQAAARTRMAQQSQQGRVGTNTTAATQTAARTSLAQRIKDMRSSGGSEGARRIAQTAFATDNSTSRSVQPKTAQAGNVKDQSRIAPGTSSADQQRGAEQDKVGVKRTQADTGPEKIKTSTQTTTTKPDYDKMSFKQAFSAARKQAGGTGGKFKYKGKEYQTNIKGTGTTAKPQEKYQASSKLKSVTPPSETKTTTSVVGGQGIAAIPGGASKMAAKPTSAANMSGGSGDYRVAAKPTSAANMSGGSGDYRVAAKPTSAQSQSMSQNAAIGSMEPRSGQQGMTVTQKRDSNYNSGVRGR